PAPVPQHRGHDRLPRVHQDAHDGREQLQDAVAHERRRGGAADRPGPAAAQEGLQLPLADDPLDEGDALAPGPAGGPRDERLQREPAHAARVARTPGPETGRARMTAPLHNRTVALAENRQLEELAGLLEEEGATVFRCPLLSILDAPDPAPVRAWL